MSATSDESPTSLASHLLVIQVGARYAVDLRQFPLPTSTEEEDTKWSGQIKKSSAFLLKYVSRPAENTECCVKFPNRHDSISVFFSITTADISVSSYLARLLRYTKCSSSAIIYAIIYLKRVEKGDSLLTVSAYSLHRLLITSIMIAAKFVDEAWYSNSYYARVAGVSTLQEMNRLEKEFLRALDYRTYVSQEEFEKLVEFGLRGANGAEIFSSRSYLARL